MFLGSALHNNNKKKSQNVILYLWKRMCILKCVDFLNEHKYKD